MEKFKSKEKLKDRMIEFVCSLKVLIFPLHYKKEKR